MTANHGGRKEPGNRILFAFFSMCAAVVLPAIAWAASYDVTVTFSPPATGVPDGYRFYVNDCAVSGPTAAPVGTVTSGQTFTGLITVDGTYQMCVRPFNAAGETLDPGPVATVVIADLPVPGPIQNLSISVNCPGGGCTVTVTIN